jgi:hypothetical protein
MIEEHESINAHIAAHGIVITGLFHHEAAVDPCMADFIWGMEFLGRPEYIRDIKSRGERRAKAARLGRIELMNLGDWEAARVAWLQEMIENGATGLQDELKRAQKFRIILRRGAVYAKKYC